MPGSGRRGRRFKSGHPDQVTGQGRRRCEAPRRRFPRRAQPRWPARAGAPPSPQVASDQTISLVTDSARSSRHPRLAIVRLAATVSMAALPGRRTRSATPTIDPASASGVLAPARMTGGGAGSRRLTRGLARLSRVTTVFFRSCVPYVGVVTPLPPGWRFPGRGKEGPACESGEAPAWPPGRGRGSARAGPGLVLRVLLARGRPARAPGRRGVGGARPAAVGQHAAGRVLSRRGRRKEAPIRVSPASRVPAAPRLRRWSACWPTLPPISERAPRCAGDACQRSQADRAGLAAASWWSLSVTCSARACASKARSVFQVATENVFLSQHRIGLLAPGAAADRARALLRHLPV